MTRLRQKAVNQGAAFKGVETTSQGSPLGTLEWNVAGNCQRPVSINVWTRPDPKGYKRVVCSPTRGHRTNVDMEVRCRACENCLKARAGHWRYRALAEWRMAPRTWLLTLTLTPESQHWCENMARSHLDAQGIDFEALETAEQFDMRHRISGALVTKYLKLLRKDGHKFRYLMVAEAHKSGLPHYHLMVHELLGSEPIPHRSLKARWTYGFSDAKLVLDEKGATYATKYLIKSKLARVRSSIAYGATVTSALTA